MKPTLTWLENVTGKVIAYHDGRTSEWCQLPYPGHPHGCTMYDERKECPPCAPFVWDYFDINMPHWFLVAKFDIEGQRRKMLSYHPNWSLKQAGCSRYWQSRVHASMKRYYESMKIIYPKIIYTLRPEAMGVLVIKTVKRLGIPIRVKPTDTIYKIMMIGYPRGNQDG